KYIRSRNRLRIFHKFVRSVQRSIASINIPPTISSEIPQPVKISGFKPSNPNYKVNSSSIEIIDRRTLRIFNFACEPCPPGTYFMIGGSLLPNPSGQIIPMQHDDGKFECHELSSFYRRETIVVKLPGVWETSDIMWLSVFNLPKKQSLSSIFLLKSLVVPPYLSDVIVSVLIPL
ncbi:unnamed protein product, partial [Soboliphyme baturini]|uniref:DM13 domain-containing protein n=1 Tax=Soboliphyme baturini TaxID=241478 RepID=A0A183IM40_9BILA